MEILQLKITRKNFNATNTIGEFSVNGEFYAYSLEDIVRTDGIKIDGQTAIPYGKYNVIVDYSNRFKKNMIHILDVPNFAGVRIHGGNTDADTLGCPLIGKQTDFISKIWDCKERVDTLIDMVECADVCTLEIVKVMS